VANSEPSAPAHLNRPCARPISVADYEVRSGALRWQPSCSMAGSARQHLPSTKISGLLAAREGTRHHLRITKATSGPADLRILIPPTPAPSARGIRCLGHERRFRRHESYKDRRGALCVRARPGAWHRKPGSPKLYMPPLRQRMAEAYSAARKRRRGRSASARAMESGWWPTPDEPRPLPGGPTGPSETGKCSRTHSAHRFRPVDPGRRFTWPSRISPNDRAACEGNAIRKMESPRGEISSPTIASSWTRPGDEVTAREWSSFLGSSAF
jgi:hypothetical protein